MNEVKASHIALLPISHDVPYSRAKYTTDDHIIELRMMRLRVAPTIMPSMTKGRAQAIGMTIIQPIYFSATAISSLTFDVSASTSKVNISRHQPTYAPTYITAIIMLQMMQSLTQRLSDPESRAPINLPVSASAAKAKPSFIYENRVNN